MASKPQTHSPFSRLSRLLRSGPSSPVDHDKDPEKAHEEDWYIPYNGPYEPPPAARQDLERDSWGQLVSGWLAEDSDDVRARYSGTTSTRNRAVSSASALTRPSGTVDPTRLDTHSSRTSRPRIGSIGNLDQSAGVGDVPMPPPSTQEQGKAESNRHSLANFLSFGQGGKRGFSLRQSNSAGQLRKDESTSANAAQSSQQLSHENTHQLSSPLHVEHGTQELYAPRHPYAFPFTAPLPRATSPTTSLQKRSVGRNKSLRTSPPSATPAYLKIPSRPNTLRGLKASISTPNLREPPALVPPRSAPIPLSLPKGRQRWLSPETWCDALILPRPRFAIRVEPGGTSGRIVSPPGSPVWPPVASPFGQTRPVTIVEPTQDEQGRRRGLYEPRSTILSVAPTSPVAGPSTSTSAPAPLAGPSRRGGSVQPQPVSRQHRNEDGGDGGGRDGLKATAESPTARLRPPRPKSFAWDDLALPSPVPSLTKVVEEGRQLEEQRKAWQAQASRSFQNKRARSLSRARAKSLVNHDARPGALGVLAERSILGRQAHPPTVHVRIRPSQSQSQASRPSGEHGTTTSVGVNTLTSMPSRTRTRSHAHSNSIGTTTSSRNQTEESFMWGGVGTEHGLIRAHSLGKSALRLVRTTATNAANLCGFASAERVLDVERRQDTIGTIAERPSPDDFEHALAREDTRVVRLHDQVRREDQRTTDEQDVVLITPVTPSEARSHRLPPPHGVGPGPSGPMGISPVTSSTSNSAEGVGIAITTPTPTDEYVRQLHVGREPLRIPAHPYAQGNAYAHRPISPDSTRGPVSANSPQSRDGASGNASGFERQQQLVVVHPYSPYAQGNHPYAAPTYSRAARESDGYQEVEVPANNALYAELTPGHIREIPVNDLRYSPSIIVEPVEATPRQGESASSASPRSHPYAAQPKRVSEWGFADALTHTLRGRSTPDSGLGTSESHVVTQDAEDDNASLQAVPDSAIHIPTSALSTERPGPPETSPRGPRARPSVRREMTQSSSNHTLASSPMEHVIPPDFRRAQSSGVLVGTSTGSSPGLVSHESSPPLSPRPLNAAEDPERFRTLFYRPPPRSRTPSDKLPSRPTQSRQPSGISSESTRSVSGLTTLARQLAEDLEELRELTGHPAEDEAASQIWGRRFGGLRGQRPDDAGPGPNDVLFHTSSGASSSPDAGSPLRFPLEQHAPLAPPRINVPEDVETSSRASSELAQFVPDDHDGRLRLRTIEALATPPPLSSPQRLSRRLSLIHFARDDEAPSRVSEENDGLRVISQYSSFGGLTSDGARSSYMTGGTNASRMSGLSQFPIPPSELTPEHMSVLNSYFDESPMSQEPLDMTLDPQSAAGVVRQPSLATFGQQSDVGHAV